MGAPFRRKLFPSPRFPFFEPFRRLFPLVSFVFSGSVQRPVFSISPPFYSLRETVSFISSSDFLGRFGLLDLTAAFSCPVPHSLVKTCFFFRLTQGPTSDWNFTPSPSHILVPGNLDPSSYLLRWLLSLRHFLFFLSCDHAPTWWSSTTLFRQLA